jgi:hypothetical protein
MAVDCALLFAKPLLQFLITKFNGKARNTVFWVLQPGADLRPQGLAIHLKTADRGKQTSRGGEYAVMNAAIGHDATIE